MPSAARRKMSSSFGLSGARSPRAMLIPFQADLRLASKC
jgi:hypothetical protein